MSDYASLILALGFLVVLLGVLFTYMWFLQYRYYATCKDLRFFTLLRA